MGTMRVENLSTFVAEVFALMRADCSKNGMPLPDGTWAAIVNAAREVGAGEVSIQRAVS
jgi:uncharacterized oxidoreductase